MDDPLELRRVLDQTTPALRQECALRGHVWRDDVPGIEGRICTRCGERPEEESK